MFLLISLQKKKKKKKKIISGVVLYSALLFLDINLVCNGQLASQPGGEVIAAMFVFIYIYIYT